MQVFLRIPPTEQRQTPLMNSLDKLVNSNLPVEAKTAVVENLAETTAETLPKCIFYLLDNSRCQGDLSNL